MTGGPRIGSPMTGGPRLSSSAAGEPRISTLTQAAAWSVSALLAFGILTLWVRDRWAVAAFQLGVLAVALLWFWLNAWVRGPIRLHPALAALAIVPSLGCLQLVLGTTVLPWFTVEKSVEWTVHWLAAFLLYQAAISRTFRRRWIGALLVFSTALAIVSILQDFTAGGKVFWLFESGHSDDVLGPFVYRNKYAQFIELVVPVALYRAILDRRWAPLYIVAGAVMVAGVVSGASRSGLIFLVVEIVAVVFFAWHSGKLTGRATALLSAQTAALMLLWGFLAGWDYLWLRLTGIDPLADLRFPLMRSSLAMIASHPLTGVGLGCWPWVYPEYASFDIGAFANQAHSDWLQWAAEGGLPLLAALLAFTAFLIRPLISSIWGIGFLIVLAHAGMDYPFQQLPAFATLLIGTAFVAASDGGK